MSTKKQIRAKITIRGPRIRTPALGRDGLPIWTEAKIEELLARFHPGSLRARSGVMLSTVKLAEYLRQAFEAERQAARLTRR